LAIANNKYTILTSYHISANKVCLALIENAHVIPATGMKEHSSLSLDSMWKRDLYPISDKPGQIYHKWYILLDRLLSGLGVFLGLEGKGN